MPTQLGYQKHYNGNAISWYPGTGTGIGTTNDTYTLWQPNHSTATTMYSITQQYQFQQSYKYRPVYGTTPYTGTGISSDYAWQQWIQYTPTPLQETPEEAAARRRRRLERDREDRAARTRARILLHEFLTDEQKAELEKHGRFHVIGSKGRRYCIRTSSQSANVDLLKPDGTVQATLCAHPREHLPLEDAFLMQMIELRHDEDHFLKTANIHRGSLPAAA